MLSWNTFFVLWKCYFPLPAIFSLSDPSDESDSLIDGLVLEVVELLAWKEAEGKWL